MKIDEHIRKLIMTRKVNTGENLHHIPLSYDEILEIERTSQTLDVVMMQDYKTLFGLPVVVTPYAEQIRTRQIELPRAVYVQETACSEDCYRESNFLDNVRHDMRMRIERAVCADTTEITLTHEWDPLAWWKRKLHLTRWFPINQKTVVLDCKILYPHINVRLPFNNHTVKIAIK